MAIFILPDLEMDMLNDLMDEINQLYEESETTLIDLELKPEDLELQRSLFRAIHTIKGDLGLVMFGPIIPLVSHVEDLLDYLRKGKVTYTSIMSDLVLLTMDRVKVFAETVINEGQIEYDEVLYANLGAQVAKVNPDNTQQHAKLLTQAVLLLDPSLKVDVEAEQPQELPDVAKGFDVELKDDLTFFREVMQPIERRSRYWAGKGDRIAKMCQYINDVAGNPIPDEQLIAACYVHDFGMAFVNHELLHKSGGLSSQEKMVIKDHVYGSTQLLKNLSQWQYALKIVMQHHERCDGSGYPLGLNDEEICDGAKLLAIIDSFEALTHERAQNTHIKRPIRRAVIQLNSEADGLFCPIWMGHFNKAIIKLISKN